MVIFRQLRLLGHVLSYPLLAQSDCCGLVPPSQGVIEDGNKVPVSLPLSCVFLDFFFHVLLLLDHGFIF